MADQKMLSNSKTVDYRLSDSQMMLVLEQQKMELATQRKFFHSTFFMCENLKRNSNDIWSYHKVVIKSRRLIRGAIKYES